MDPRNVPAGISIEDVSAENGIVEFTFNVDETVESRQEGSLLFDRFVLRKRAGRGKNGDKDTKREPLRIPVGTLPAIPFETK